MCSLILQTSYPRHCNRWIKPYYDQLHWVEKVSAKFLHWWLKNSRNQIFFKQSQAYSISIAILFFWFRFSKNSLLIVSKVEFFCFFLLFCQCCQFLLRIWTNFHKTGRSNIFEILLPTNGITIINIYFFEYFNNFILNLILIKLLLDSFLTKACILNHHRIGDQPHELIQIYIVITIDKLFF